MSSSLITPTNFKQNMSMKSLETKKKEAIERNEYYSSLTIEQKIARLDKKLGKNKGAEKQRKKLIAKLAIV